MNGIERITGRIQADAQAEIDRRIGAARAEAEEILSGYRTLAETESRSMTEKNEKAAAAREERLVSMAHMEARKITLAARQEMVERAYERALDLLCSMPEDRYAEALSDLLVEAASSGQEEVLFNARDRKLVGDRAVSAANTKANLKLVLSTQTANIRGGFILRDRNTEVNGSFETLIRLQKTQTAGEVAKRLFPVPGAKTETPAPAKADESAKAVPAAAKAETPAPAKVDSQPPAKSAPVKSEAAKSAPAKSEAAKSAPSKTEPAKAEASKPESGERVRRTGNRRRKTGTGGASGAKSGTSGGKSGANGSGKSS